MSKTLAVAVFSCCIAAASAQTQERLTITTASLESCVIDQPCSQQLHANGGTPPLNWRIARGSLPQGLQLDPASGTISGSATSAGDYEVVIQVRDSSNPQQETAHTFTSKTLASLILDWKAPPTTQSTIISGSVTVSNTGADVIDLTVIIVAVNEVGKAFALGYQHFNLPAKTANQEIPFGLQLPGGRYTVRADAIGEVPPRNKIYRSARQAGPLQVPVQ